VDFMSNGLKWKLDLIVGIYVYTHRCEKSFTS